jgi:hypothetical protein
MAECLGTEEQCLDTPFPLRHSRGPLNHTVPEG